MVGPGLDVQGGVSAVIRLLLEHPPEEVAYSLQPTINSKNAAFHLSNRILYYKNSINNLANLLKVLSSISRHAIEFDLAHIHLSSRGSTFRKYFISNRLYKIGLPFIFHNHGGRYHLFYSKLPSFLKRQVQTMFLRAQGTIVLSEKWCQFHREIIPRKDYPLWVMPNPVVLPDTVEFPSDEELRLLFLGLMGEHKGTDRILIALSKLPEAVRRRVRLYMAGNGDTEKMRQLAHELGLQSQVEIRNWIEGAEKQRWLRLANAFILPSRDEGLPMAMLEAMAYGKALIVSPVGGIPEFVTDGQEGILVPPDDIDAISEAIRRLAESPELRMQMGMAARARVEPLSMEHYRQRLGTIYTTTLQRAQSR
jgi:glycosyltransferase involved in cell wall biosynthesis